MNVFTTMYRKIREVIHRLIPYRSIEQVERAESSLSPEMGTALEKWYQMYLDNPDWADGQTVKSMNLPASLCSELARQVTLELKVNISGKNADGSSKDDNGDKITNPRSEYLAAEFEKAQAVLRGKLEQALAAGGMVVKPYPNVDDGHIYFDWTMDWSLYPLAFDDDNGLCDVVIPDTFVEGKTYYTRLERHQIKGNDVHITQRAFKSNNGQSIGTEVPLTAVDRWASLQPESDVKDTDGGLFGWFKVASANNVDIDSPMGVAMFAKAVNTIKEADIQYSRLLWEYEGSELAIDVDPTILRPKKTLDANGNTIMETPKLNQRLFRGVDADKGDRDLYEVFSPNIRDANLINGLNRLLMRIEDLCGISRGTLSEPQNEAKTATELKILQQRSYATVHDNQKALEHCLRDVVNAMDKYATLYNLAPEGEYDISFEWDDSIITDTSQQMQDRMMLFNAGLVSKKEMRMWYLGETDAQASAALEAMTVEQIANMEALMPLQNPGVPAP